MIKYSVCVWCIVVVHIKCLILCVCVCLFFFLIQNVNGAHTTIYAIRIISIIYTRWKWYLKMIISTHTHRIFFSKSLLCFIIEKENILVSMLLIFFLWLPYDYDHDDDMRNNDVNWLNLLVHHFQFHFFSLCNNFNFFFFISFPLIIINYCMYAIFVVWRY